MKKSRKKIIVAILLVTMLSQTLYSAAAGMFGLSTQKYAYADDEMAEDVEPGEDVDETTQDDADVVQRAPGEETPEGEEKMSVLVTLTATFFETMVGGEPDAALPSDTGR